MPELMPEPEYFAADMKQGVHVPFDENADGEVVIMVRMGDRCSFQTMTIDERDFALKPADALPAFGAEYFKRAWSSAQKHDHPMRVTK